MLEARGATVVHVPLIEIQEPTDGGERFRRELAGLRNFDWLVVTSVPGAERVGRAAAETRRTRSGRRRQCHGTGAGRSGRTTSRSAAVGPAGRDPRRSPHRALPRRAFADVRGAGRPRRTDPDRAVDRCRTRRDGVRRLSHRAAPTGPLDGGRRGRAGAGERFLGAGVGRCVRTIGRRRWSWRSARPRRPWPRNWASRLSAVATESSLAGLLAELERCF